MSIGVYSIIFSFDRLIHTYTHTETHTQTHTIFVVGPKREIDILKWESQRRYLYFFGFIYFILTYVYIFSLFLSLENIWHRALLMGYSIKLEFTRVCSLNGFHLVMGLYRVHSCLFLRDSYISLLYLSLVFDIWYVFLVVVCVCVCVCEWFRYSGFTEHPNSSLTSRW